MSEEIILIQPKCGKYDAFILDMPLSLLYASRLLVKAGFTVHILDQRIEKDTIFDRIDNLLARQPLWIGITAMTGEPIRHALKLCRYIKEKSHAPVVWGGIHPTILSRQTLENPFIDYVIRGKAERAVLAFTQYLLGKAHISSVAHKPDGSSQFKVVTGPRCLAVKLTVHLPGLA